MKCSATSLSDVLSDIASYGSSKIETNNVLIYRRPADNKLIFGVASRSTFLRVESNITLPPDDELKIETAISINEKTLRSIISGMGKYEVEIKINESNPTFITFTTSKETYDVAFQTPVIDDITRIFGVEPSDCAVILKDIPVSSLKYIPTVINNLGILCADNQFRTIIHRKGTDFKCIFITGTTLNVIEEKLPEHESYDTETDHGVDTNTGFLPKALSQVLSHVKNDANITMQYDSTSVYYSTDKMLMRTSFDPKGENMTKSIQMYHNLRTVIDMSNANVLTIKVPGSELEEMINKAALVLSKSAVTRLDSYIPLYITSQTEVRLEAKSTTGSYKSKISEQVQIEGLSESYEKDSAIYNMNIPMMRSMLNTINKTHSGVINIELRDTLENKTYVRLTNDLNRNITYYIRLRR